MVVLVTDRRFLGISRLISTSISDIPLRNIQSVTVRGSDLVDYATLDVRWRGGKFKMGNVQPKANAYMVRSAIEAGRKSTGSTDPVSGRKVSTGGTQPVPVKKDFRKGAQQFIEHQHGEPDPGYTSLVRRMLNPGEEVLEICTGTYDGGRAYFVLTASVVIYLFPGIEPSGRRGVGMRSFRLDAWQDYEIIAKRDGDTLILGHSLSAEKFMLEHADQARAFPTLLQQTLNNSFEYFHGIDEYTRPFISLTSHLEAFRDYREAGPSTLSELMSASFPGWTEQQIAAHDAALICGYIAGASQFELHRLQSEVILDYLYEWGEQLPPGTLRGEEVAWVIARAESTELPELYLTQLRTEPESETEDVLDEGVGYLLDIASKFIDAADPRDRPAQESRFQQLLQHNEGLERARKRRDAEQDDPAPSEEPDKTVEESIEEPPQPVSEPSEEPDMLATIELLERLTSLYNSGALSDEEYASLKAKALGGNST